MITTESLKSNLIIIGTYFEFKKFLTKKSKNIGLKQGTGMELTPGGQIRDELVLNWRWISHKRETNFKKYQIDNFSNFREQGNSHPIT